MVAASEFRNTWKDVVRKADSAHHQVSAMAKGCSKETSVQVQFPNIPDEFQSEQHFAPARQCDMDGILAALPI